MNGAAGSLGKRCFTPESTKALAARPLPEPPALVAATLAEIEKAVGGRDALVAALAYAPKGKDASYVLGIIGDPRNSARSLAQCCAMGGITPGELLTLYKAGAVHCAQALSTKLVAQELPGVVADTLRKAVPHEGICPTCEGLTTVVASPTKRVSNPEPQTCPSCKGKGVVPVDGEIEHKKLALELGQLTSKGAGVNLTVNQQNNSFGGVGGALEHLQAASDRILYGEGIVEAEVLDAVTVEEQAVAPAPFDTQIDGDWREDRQP